MNLINSLAVVSGGKRQLAGVNWKTGETDFPTGGYDLASFYGSLDQYFYDWMIDDNSSSPYYNKVIYFGPLATYSSSDGNPHNVQKLPKLVSSAVSYYTPTSSYGPTRWVPSLGLYVRGTGYDYEYSNSLDSSFTAAGGSWYIDYHLKAQFGDYDLANYYKIRRMNSGNYAYVLADTTGLVGILCPTPTLGQGIQLSPFFCSVAFRNSNAAALGNLLFDFTNIARYIPIKMLRDPSSGTHYIVHSNGYISKTTTDLSHTLPGPTNKPVLNWTSSSWTDATPQPRRGISSPIYVEGLNKFISWDPFALDPVIVSTNLTSWSPIKTNQALGTTYFGQKVQSDAPDMSILSAASDATGTNIVLITSIYGTGLWRSGDSGQTWSQYQNLGYMHKVLFTGGGKFVIASSTGIYLSTDNGVTWTNKASFTQLGYGTTDYCVVAYSGNQTGSPGTILVFRATNSNNTPSYYRSTDGGNTWTTYTALYGGGISAAAWDPNTSKFLIVPTGSSPANSWKYIHESADGITWSATSFQVPETGYTAGTRYIHDIIIKSGRYYVITANSIGSPAPTPDVSNLSSPALYTVTSLSGLSSASNITLDIDQYSGTHLFPGTTCNIGNDLLNIWAYFKYDTSLSSYSKIGLFYINIASNPSTILSYSTSSTKEYIRGLAVYDAFLDGSNMIFNAGYRRIADANKNWPDFSGIYSVATSALNGSSTVFDSITEKIALKWPAVSVANNYSLEYYFNYSGVTSYPFYMRGLLNSDAGSTAKYYKTTGLGSDATNLVEVTANTQLFNRFANSSGVYSSSDPRYTNFISIKDGVSRLFVFPRADNGHQPYYNINTSTMDLAFLSGYSIQSIASNGRGTAVYRVMTGPTSGDRNNYVAHNWLAYPSSTSPGNIRMASLNEDSYVNGYDTIFVGGTYVASLGRYRKINVIWNQNLNHFYTIVGGAIPLSGTSNPMTSRKAAISTDGVSWTYSTITGINSSYRISYVLYTGSKYILFQDTATTAYESTDGITYTAQAGTTSSFTSVCCHAFRPNDQGNQDTYGLRRLVIAGTNGSNAGRFLYSDGHNLWQQSSYTGGTQPATEIRGIIWSYTHSKFVAIERGSDTSPAYLWTSPDGDTWTRGDIVSPAGTYRFFEGLIETSDGIIVFYGFGDSSPMIRHTENLTTFQGTFGQLTGPNPWTAKNYSSYKGSANAYFCDVYPINNDTPNYEQRGYVKLGGGSISVADTGRPSVDYSFNGFTSPYGTSLNRLNTADVLLVGGGGGGGGKYSFTGTAAGGGGGAGKFLSLQNVKIKRNTEYAITVGEGGAGGPADSSSIGGGTGGNTTFGNWSVVGGGGGGSAVVWNSWAGIQGGSGGGGGANSEGGTVSGIYGLGNIGGEGSGTPNGGDTPYASDRGGGGGGAGGSGSKGGDGGTGFGGHGGPGLQWFDGNMYAAGGGGGAATSEGDGTYPPVQNFLGGNGGSSIGGNGGGYTTVAYGPTSPSQNTGSGGGGAARTFMTGTAGARGVVIIRFPYIGASMGWSITGNLTYTDWNTGGYRYFKFTSGSGTIAFNYTP